MMRVLDKGRPVDKCTGLWEAAGSLTMESVRSRLPDGQLSNAIPESWT